MKSGIFLMLAPVLLLGGCDSYGHKEGIGTLAGAALGAWAGSAVSHRGAGGVVAVATGTVIGGIIGNQIGKGLDKADRLEMERAQYRTLEYGRSGERNTWHNPDSGHSGSYEARPAYKTSDGAYCREFTQTVDIGGRKEEAFGKACRQPDGAWKIVS